MEYKAKQAYDINDETHRSDLMSMILHAVDIGTATMPFTIFDMWGARCVQEFHDQWELEEADDLGPSTGFLKYNGKKAYCRGQAGFVKSIVRPMWADLVTMFPQIQEALDNMDNNIECLEQEASKLEKADAY